MEKEPLNSHIEGDNISFQTKDEDMTDDGEISLEDATLDDNLHSTVNQSVQNNTPKWSILKLEQKYII